MYLRTHRSNVNQYLKENTFTLEALHRLRAIAKECFAVRQEPVSVIEHTQGLVLAVELRRDISCPS